MRRRVIALLVVLTLAWGGLAWVLATGTTPKLGLDLQGGTSVLLRAPEGTGDAELKLAVEIMRRRIEDFGGVQEPEISISGDGTVQVQLPGITDQERALGAIGQTGQLSFRPVLDVGVGPVSPLLLGEDQGVDSLQELLGGTTTTAAEETTTTTTTVPTTTTTLPPGVDPETGLTIEDDPTQEAWLPQLNADGTIAEVLHVGPAALSGGEVADAQAGFPTIGVGEWQVLLDLTSEGGGLFEEVTKQLAAEPVGSPRRRLAIVLDGEVISAPQVATDVDPDVGIAGGRATITLGNDEQAARDLAVVLRYGALPVAFQRDQVQKVSASLGEDSLRSGLYAGIGGLTLVALVVMLYYRALGTVTVLGLTVFGSLLVIIFGVLGSTRGLTLTLAGVTGIIVAVGITADSYIVFFERVKEELRDGRTVRSAADEGFRLAFRTILTADTVSFLGAFLLWWLAIGPVKGFALSLGIATLLDVFIAYFFTRNAVALVAAGRWGDGGAFSIRGAAGLVRREVAT